MSKSNHWLLPDGVEELLPPMAWRAESLRRKLLDLYRAWGYELISPPLIEYIDSLLSGTGNDLDLQTFKVTDQLTGRLMGVRADITPQAARIDAHCWKKKGVSRLCYADSVLHTVPENQMTGRSPIQVGCELFGSRALESDIEILRLMIETIALTDAKGIHIDLSHVGIYRGLLDQVEISTSDEALLTDAIRRKSIPDVSRLLSELSISDDIAEMIAGLPSLIGGEEVFADADTLFAGAGEQTKTAISELRDIHRELSSAYPELSISIDLSDLRGYHYHTGIVFAGYVQGFGRAVAKGGRYDAIGEIFGRPRAATGFSCDLKSLIAVGQDQSDSHLLGAIYAPAEKDPALASKIAELRKTRSVVQGMADDQSSPADKGCTDILVKEGSDWVVNPLSN